MATLEDIKASATSTLALVTEISANVSLVDAKLDDIKTLIAGLSLPQSEIDQVFAALEEVRIAATGTVSSSKFVVDEAAAIA